MSSDLKRRPIDRTDSATPVSSAPRPRSGTAVEFRGVTRVFGPTTALDGLNLTVDPGELLALLGPSGCGKTTALRILAGFDAPSKGVVLVDGADITRTSASRRDMGMVFQAYSLFPTMSARDNVGFGLRLRKQEKRVRHDRAGELLDLVGLSAHADKFPHQLSGGQQQRVALARALAISPRVLLLDEPLSALDAKVREQLREEIRHIQLELGVTTVFVTHDQEEALTIADRVAVMNEGRLEQVAAPSEIYHRPSTAFVAQFVGSMNRLPATVVGDGQIRLDAGGQLLPVPSVAGVEAGSRVVALVRPEGVVVTPEPDGNAVVVLTAFRGATTRIQLRMDDGTEVRADLGQHEADGVPAGARVRVTVRQQPALIQEA